MATIHHQISKWASRNGVAIAANGDGSYTFTQTATGISATGANGTAVKAELEAKLKADKKAVAAQAPAPKKAKTGKKAKKAESSERPEKKTIVTGKSGVMKLPYHTRYMNNGGGSGDDLDVALRAAVCKPVEKGSKKTAVDMDELQAIAEANGVWKPEYASLNPGMARMNVANRLRGKGRKGEVVKVKGKVIDIPLPEDTGE